MGAVMNTYTVFTGGRGVFGFVYGRPEEQSGELVSVDVPWDELVGPVARLVQLDGTPLEPTNDGWMALTRVGSSNMGAFTVDPAPDEDQNLYLEWSDDSGVVFSRDLIRVRRQPTPAPW